MKLLSEYFRGFVVNPEKQRVEVIVNILGCVIFGFAAIVTFSIAIVGLNQGFPFVASMGLLIFSFILVLLVIAIPSITNKCLA